MVIIVLTLQCYDCDSDFRIPYRAVRDGAAGVAMAAPLFQGPCAIGFAN